MHLIIVGRGKMARLFKEECQKIPGEVTCTSVEELPLPVIDKSEKPIVIHVGSGRLLPKLIEECAEKDYRLIQASSGQKLPESVPGVVINAPNLGLLILALLDVLPRLGALAQGIDATTEVTESHQASKTSAPITAQIIAGHFGNPPESVKSIRDPNVQTTLGVPSEYLDGHAYHFVKIKAHGVEAELAFKVHGRRAYFLGALAVARKVLDAELLPGIYPAHLILFA